jgi:hypothetical protein
VVVLLFRKNEGGFTEVQGYFNRKSEVDIQRVLINCGRKCNILATESSDRMLKKADDRSVATNRANCDAQVGDTNDVFTCLAMKLTFFCQPIMGVLDSTCGCHATCDLCKLHFDAQYQIN